jgi:hypothetical protein
MRGHQPLDDLLFYNFLTISHLFQSYCVIIILFNQENYFNIFIGKYHDLYE